MPGSVRNESRVGAKSCPYSSRKALLKPTESFRNFKPSDMLSFFFLSTCQLQEAIGRFLRRERVCGDVCYPSWSERVPASQ